MATLTYTYTLTNLTAVVLGYTGNLGNLIIYLEKYLVEVQ